MTTARLVRALPLVLALFVPFVACGGSVGGETTDAGADSLRAETSDDLEACESLGGKCGPTADLPCGDGERSVRARCDESRPCCVTLPPLGPGECRVAADCGSQRAPGRPAGGGACEAGACVCDAASVRLENGRCGPIAEAGESYLCSSGTAFPKLNAVCGVIPCDAGGTCAPSGATAQCVPAVARRNGEETCVLVNCGAIFCAAGLVCTDAARGVCKVQ